MPENAKRTRGRPRKEPAAPPRPRGRPRKETVESNQIPAVTAQIIEPVKPPVKLPAKMGRPSTYTQEIAGIICSRMANGETLAAICRDDGMPHKMTVFRWQDAHAEFRDQYARARIKQADAFVEQVVEIANNATDANIARLQVDARKWVASKMQPQKYGDHQRMHVSGTVDVAGMLDDDLNNRILSLAASLGQAAALANAGGKGTQDSEIIDNG